MKPPASLAPAAASASPAPTESPAPRPARWPAEAPPRAAGPAITHLLYLHGFRSSPASFKAQRVAARVQALQAAGRPLVWACPQLPGTPAQALQQVRDAVAAWPAASMAVIGSSLGGFYADLIAQARGCRAVLLNPAVNPARDLARYIGSHPSWHDPATQIVFTAADVADLAAMQAARSRPGAQTLAVIATGDEVLDAAEMQAHCAGARCWVGEGGDHALSDFDTAFAAVQHFLGLDAVRGDGDPPGLP